MTKQVEKRKTPAHWQYPANKLGKGFWMEEYENLKLHCDVPNADRFNTVQMEVTGWLSINPEAEQHDLDKMTSKIKKRIKDKIRDWKQQFFLPSAIVIFETGSITYQRRDYQFFTVEVTHFVKPKMTYDKQTLIRLLYPFYIEIIDNYIIDDNDIFKIVRNHKMDNRASKSNRTRGERRESQRV